METVSYFDSFKYRGKNYYEGNIESFFANLGTYTEFPNLEELQTAVDSAFKLGAKLSNTSKLSRRLYEAGIKLPFDMEDKPVDAIANVTAPIGIVLSKKREAEAHIARKYYEKYINASRRGIEFDLCISDFKKLLKAKKCAYTGVAFEKEGPNSITIERIDNSLGYVPGNCIPVTEAANQWKAHVLECPPSHLPKLNNVQLLQMLNVIEGHK